MYSRPAQLETLLPQISLQVRQLRLAFANASGRLLGLDGVCRNRSGCLANVPFHRMQAIAPVGYVCDAQVLAASE
jgi:hypothetical protein